MTKTTIEISDDLLRRAKQAALERDTTLRTVVEDALARALGPSDVPDAALRTLTWPPARELDASHLDAARLDAEAVLAAIARERERAPEDPGRREGRLEPAPRHHKKKRKK